MATHASSNNTEKRNRWNNTKKNKNNKKKTALRITKKDSNYGFNNDVSDAQEAQIYNSLSKAVSNNNKLTDSELMKLFQDALSKLNAAWFRHNLPLFFMNIADVDIGDIVLFILRLFLLNFDLKNTKHSVPFRYLLLDLIAPTLHDQNKNHKTAQLLDPTPQITDHHRLYALNIFSLWILEITQNMKTHKHKHKHKQEERESRDAITLETFHKYPHKTLRYLSAKEMECLFKAFELNEILSSRIQNKICDKIYDLLHSDNDAASAVKWCIYFDLMDDIAYDVLLLPLLKEQSLLHYALYYIDSIPARKTQYIEKIKQFITVTIAKLMQENKTNITASRAVKLLSNWKFDITQKEYEPMVIWQIKNFLKWIIIKGHIDDYAIMVCSHSKTLQYFVIKQCRNHPSTYTSCIKWAKYWNLQADNRCKRMIKHCSEWCAKNEYTGKAKQETFINGFDDIDYCDINESQIVLVNSVDTLDRAKQVLLDDGVDCIGLDLELLACDLMIPSVPKHCQILQISTADSAFIFDLQCMGSDDVRNGFDELLSEIFSESRAVKIGIGWDGDLKNLRKQYPDALAFKSVCTPYLDLMVITKFMKNDPEFQEKVSIVKVHPLDDAREKKIKNRFKRTKDKEGGLAKIVRFVLNRKLNKFEQLSNWSNRPLRIEQLKYAALDAMVECQIYRKFKEWQKQTILPDISGFCDSLY